MTKLLIIFFLLGTIVLSASAQYYTTGDDPLSMRLRQIKTNYSRIIFDAPMQPWAVRMARQIDSIAPAISASLGYTPRRTDIVLHSRSAYSNGLVSWAPSRLEMYTFSQADGDCVPWYTHLALHEYRHVVQTSMLNQGFTHFLNIIFGEQATGAVLGLYVPLWLMEGDAILNETAMSMGGRGRQAAFVQQMRTLSLTNQTPTYDQAYNGSYRHRIPDYYHMGYLTVSNVQLRYGPNVWRNALENVGRKSFSFVPFNRSLRQSTGKYKTDLYYEAMHDWTQRWQKQDSTIVPTPYTIIMSSGNDYSENISAQTTNNTIVAYQTSLNNIPRIVDANGRTIATPTIRNESNIAAQGNTIVWCEMRPHQRWSNAYHTALMRSDSNGQHKRTLLKHQMLSAPSVAPDETQIATVATLRNGNQQIWILSNKGKVQTTINLQPAEQATATAWLTGTTIVYTSLTDSGKCLKAINLPTLSIRQLTAAKFENIRHIAIRQGTIYYTSDESGIDNIYCISPNGTAERITSARYGAAWPCPTDTALIYSNYSPTGYSIVSTPLSTRPTDTPISPMHTVANALSTTEHSNISPTTPTDTTTTRYSRAAHLWRIHSWGPIVVDASSNTASTGLAIASQNTLGNSILSAGINFDANTTERYFASYTYTALYPKIKLSAHWGYYNYKLDGVLLNTEETAGTRYVYDEKQRHQHYKAQIYVPLQYAYSAWQYGVHPSLCTNYYHANAITLSTQTFEVHNKTYFLTGEEQLSKIYRTNYTDLEINIYAYATKRYSARTVGCRMGMAAEIGRNISVGSDDYGKRNYAMLTLYLPGIGQHHNITVQAQMHNKSKGSQVVALNGQTYTQLIGDATNNPRGTTTLRNTHSRLLRLNYTLPLLNPDLSLGPLCYIKRICLRAFYDTQRIKTCPIYNEATCQWTTRSSAGSEIWAESYLLRLPYAFRIGYRGSQVIDGQYKSEIIFAVTFK